MERRLTYIRRPEIGRDHGSFVPRRVVHRRGNVGKLLLRTMHVDIGAKAIWVCGRPLARSEPR